MPQQLEYSGQSFPTGIAWTDARFSVGTFHQAYPVIFLKVRIWSFEEKILQKLITMFLFMGDRTVSFLMHTVPS